MDSHQERFCEKLQELLLKQAEDHNNYCKESSERMRNLNEMMLSYIEMQKETLKEYITQIDKLSSARASAQENASKLIDALHEEQTKNRILLDIIRNMTSSPSAAVNIHSLTPKNG